MSVSATENDDSNTIYDLQCTPTKKVKRETTDSETPSKSEKNADMCNPTPTKSQSK